MFHKDSSKRLNIYNTIVIFMWLSPSPSIPALRELAGDGQALIAGKLAALAGRRIKAFPQEFREALRGRVADCHGFLYAFTYSRSTS